MLILKSGGWVCIFDERIEPMSAAWEAAILPLNYRRRSRVKCNSPLMNPPRGNKSIGNVPCGDRNHDLIRVKDTR